MSVARRAPIPSSQWVPFSGYVWYPYAMDQEYPRLQKALAAAGVASRRACEEMISQGRVAVNGKVVREPGTKVNPAADDVRVDGIPVFVGNSPRFVYLMLNKPL